MSWRLDAQTDRQTCKQINMNAYEYAKRRSVHGRILFKYRPTGRRTMSIHSVEQTTSVRSVFLSTLFRKIFRSIAKNMRIIIIN